MKTAGVLLVIVGVAIGAMTLLFAAAPGWPGSANDPRPAELRIFATVAAACFVLGMALLVT